MKAIILAAGTGSRLKPITNKRPKCLVKVCGKPILDHQIDAYKKAGIEEIIILTGYKSEMIETHIRKKRGLKITLIHNKDYLSTNNMMSLYLAKKNLTNTFCLSNGDVIYDPKIIKELVQSKDENLIVADEGTYDIEAMKVTINSKGDATDISKEIPENKAYGNSIDLYKFSKEGSQNLFKLIDQKIKKKIQNEWTEVAIQELLQEQKSKMKIYNIKGKKWMEIDTHEDWLIAEKKFSSLNLKKTKQICIDMDGTLYSGDEPIQGAKEAIQRLLKENKKVYFMSNNSSKNKKEYVKKLKKLGIPSKESQITLSTDGLIDYLKAKQITEVFALGNKTFYKTLKTHKINPKSDAPTHIILAYDTDLSYKKLQLASEYMQSGIPLLVTHPDKFCPTAKGNIPDAGYIKELLENTTGISAKKIFGKPNKEMLTQHLKAHSAKETLIIGDRLHTDIELAKACQAKSILVLTGETDLTTLQDSHIWPDLVVNSIAEITRLT